MLTKEKIPQCVKDTVRFFLVYVLIAAVTAGLYLIYIHLAFEPHISASRDVFTGIYGNEIDSSRLDFEKTMSDTELIARLLYLIPMTLSFCSVFYSVPPKPAKQMMLSAGLIFLSNAVIGLYVLRDESFVMEVAAFAFCVLLPWAGSWVAFKFSEFSNKQKLKRLPKN